MWLKDTLRCDMQSMFPLLTYRTLDQVFYLPSMLCARSIEPPLEASSNLPLVYLSMTPCLLDQLSNSSLIDVDLFGERISMSHWRVTVWQGSPLECQLPHLLQTYQWSGDFFPCCPLAAQAVEKSFYVDDCLTGADTVQDAIELQEQLQELFHKGGFLLRKWNTSKPTVCWCHTRFSQIDGGTNWLHNWQKRLMVLHWRNWLSEPLSNTRRLSTLHSREKWSSCSNLTFQHLQYCVAIHDQADLSQAQKLSICGSHWKMSLQRMSLRAG